jgi:hypothetical protein
VLTRLKEQLGVAGLALGASLLYHNPKFLAIAALTGMLGYVVISLIEFIQGFVEARIDARRARQAPKLTPAQERFYELREQLG